MTCAADGELGALCQRVQALEQHWRPEEVENIRQCLAEAAGLPPLRAATREALRLAEDELAPLRPDGTQATQDVWHAVQGSVTHLRRELVRLAEDEVMLQSYLEGELWRDGWRRTRAAAGVAELHARQPG